MSDSTATAGMSRADLHAFLTTRFGLVADPGERGDGQTYFLGAVDWRPGSTTRILRAQWQADRVLRLRLCLSSDNNNSVFVTLPAAPEALTHAIGSEIARWHALGGGQP